MRVILLLLIFLTACGEYIFIPVEKERYFAKCGIIETEVSEAHVGSITQHTVFSVYIYEHENSNTDVWFSVVDQGLKSIYHLSNSISAAFPDESKGGIEIFGQTFFSQQTIQYIPRLKGVVFDRNKDNKVDANNPNHWYLYYQDRWWMWDVTAMNIDWAIYITAKKDYFLDSGIIEVQVDKADVSNIMPHTVFYIDVSCYKWPCDGFSVRRIGQGEQSIYDVSGILNVYFDPSKNNKIDNSNTNNWYLYYQNSWWMWDVTALDIDWVKPSSSVSSYHGLYR